MDGRWPVAAFLEIFFFAIIFGFFRIFILPSVNLCRVLFRHSAKALPSARQKALGKASLPINSLSSAALDKAFAECISGFAECRRHSAKCRFPVWCFLEIENEVLQVVYTLQINGLG